MKIKKLDISSGGSPVVMLNEKDARKLGIVPLDRVEVYTKKHDFTAIVDTTDTVVSPGEIGVFKDIWETEKLKGKYNVRSIPSPNAVCYIKKRLLGCELTKKEIKEIIHAIKENALSGIEISYFVASAFVKHFSELETMALIDAISKSGDTLSFGKNVFDKHCIGGVPGNRTTPIIVPICAAAGLTVPKNSSRAITSPAGTADVMEVFCPVVFPAKKVTKIVKKTGACMVWGGGLNLVPADDKILRVRYPLRIDPPAFLISSILAKKKAVGSDHVLIDIPIGQNAKIKSELEAKRLANKFILIGAKAGMDVDCVITKGNAPIGRGIGPALEARDVLRVLEGEGPEDLREKCLELSGVILEMAKKAKKGKGYELARKYLENGKALKKFHQIIKAQGGKKISSKDIKLGKYKLTVSAKEEMIVEGFDSSAISKVCRELGCPDDKKAGIYLYIGVGDGVKKDEVLYDIYSSSEVALSSAKKILKNNPIIVEGKTIIDVIEKVEEI